MIFISNERDIEDLPEDLDRLVRSFLERDTWDPETCKINIIERGESRVRERILGDNEISTLEFMDIYNNGKIHVVCRIITDGYGELSIFYKPWLSVDHNRLLDDFLREIIDIQAIPLREFS
jgi:uncharacterized protein (UPF0248 family)